MNIYKTFEQSFVRTVTEIFTELGTDCIPIISHQNGVEPPENYCVINTLMISATGRAEYSNGLLNFDQLSQSLKQYSVRNYEVTVQLDFLGKNAAENCMDYWSQFSGNTVIREKYLRNNLSPRRITDMRRSPQLRETVWVEGYSFDIVMGFAVQTAQDINWAEYLSVNGEDIQLPN